MQYKDLPINNKFCPLPWIGTMISPNGLCMSCCVQKQSTNPTNFIENNTIADIRNNEFNTKLRMDMISGIQNTSCEQCWHTEANGADSLRQIRISEYQDVIDNLDIQLDGSLLPSDDILHWDVRQTNLCNMKCVTCGPGLSSLWNGELRRNKMSNSIGTRDIIDASDNSLEDILQTVKKSIPRVSSFYFAGGEPLISDMHWDILYELILQERTDVKLSYNTNLLKMNYKGHNAIETWSHFEQVYVGVSIDCIGPRAEYVRKGTKWNTVESNFKTLYNELPNQIGLHITTSVMTIAALQETLEWAAQWQQPSNKIKIYANNLVYDPAKMSINILPNDMKNKYWQTIKTPLRQLDDANAYSLFEEELFSTIPQDQLDHLRSEFKIIINALDQVRKTNIKTYCPELAEWFDGIEIIC